MNAWTTTTIIAAPPIRAVHERTECTCRDSWFTATYLESERHVTQDWLALPTKSNSLLAANYCRS
jgi:hypothetical protein